MHNCPHCNATSISSWRKFNSSHARPTTCRACGGLSHISTWSMLGFNLALQILFPLSIVLTLQLDNWFALLILPLGLYGMYYAATRFCALRETDKDAASKANKYLNIFLVVFIAVIVSIFLLKG